MLARAGKKVCVIEKQAILGGLASTVSRNGLTFDVGPHALPTRNEDLIKLIYELCDDDIIKVPRSTSIYHSKSYFKQPLDLKNVINNIDYGTGLKILFELLLLAISRPFSQTNFDDSFESLTNRKMGKTIYELFFGPYTHKVWGRNPTEISHRLASQRLAKTSLKDLIKIFFGKESEDHDLHFKDFFYHKQGIGKIYDNMAEAVKAEGGEIFLNSQIIEIKRNESRITSIELDIDGRSHKLESSFVLSTIPLTDLIRSITPRFESKLYKIEKKLSYRSLVFLFLQVSKDWARDDQWIYFLDKKVPFNRVSSQRQMSNHMISGNGTILCIEFSCDEGDNVWNQDKNYFYNLCIPELVDAGLIEESDVIDYFLLKRNNVYPVYSIGYLHELRQVFEYLKKIDNLVSYGRQGFYNNDTNMSRCYEIACKASSYVMKNPQGTSIWYEQLFKSCGY